MTEEHIIEAEDIQEVDAPEEEAQAEKVETKIEKGLVLYHGEDNITGYSFINSEKVTLHDVAFYKRYLDHIEEKMWEEQGGFNRAGSKE